MQGIYVPVVLVLKLVLASVHTCKLLKICLLCPKYNYYTQSLRNCSICQHYAQCFGMPVAIVINIITYYNIHIYLFHDPCIYFHLLIKILW